MCPGGGLPPLLSTQVIGHSNFGTIRSTTCVYKGEAMLRCGPASAGRFKGPGLMAEAVFVYLLGLTWLFPGKWVYEVLISSQGLMQIGWCTINCRFNQEEGVGDTHNSYAYDGNRVRKWNVTTTNYGKVRARPTCPVPVPAAWQKPLGSREGLWGSREGAGTQVPCTRGQSPLSGGGDTA